MKKVVYANIEAERLKKGMSKTDLAQSAGITPRTYYNYICGIAPIPSKVLLVFSKTLNCSVDHLLS